jgi:hypothetical protein
MVLTLVGRDVDMTTQSLDWIEFISFSNLLRVGGFGYRIWLIGILNLSVSA